jgi:quercetin dioxygenase-like cupin family protein
VTEFAFPVQVSRFPDDEDWVVNEGWDIRSKRLRADGCDVVFATYPKGMTLAPHQHDTKEIVGVVSSGRVRMTIDGQERVYAAGDWFEVRTSVVHAATYEEDCSQIELVFPAGPAGG